MVDYKKGSHTIYDIKYHIVWVTKYRYKVLNKAIGERLRELLRQGCETIGVTIVQGSIGKDHVHMLISSTFASLSNFCFSHICPSK
jgi:putative transposase